MRKIFSDRMKKTSKNIVKYILELLIVAFGVFLGIYIGEQNSQQKTDSNTKNALTQIISELNSNSKRLEYAINYHEQIGIELDSATNSLELADYNKAYFNNNKFNHNNLPSWAGVQTVRLPKTIYESSKIGGVFQELNISTIKLISSIYELQDIYNDISKSTMDSFLGFNSETKTSDVIQLLKRISKYDILTIEKELFNQMKIGAKKLEKIVENKSYKK